MMSNHQQDTRLYETAAATARQIAERMLTRRYAGPERGLLSRVFRPGGKAALERFRSAHLVGFGFGAKESNGRITGDLAARVYVRKKLPLADLPRRLRVPETIDGLVTDVVPVGNLRLHARPVPLGAGIGRVTGGRGTLGCIVENGIDPDRFLLTAAHVIAPDDTARKGDAIIEPSARDGGTQTIATLDRFEALRVDGEANVIDAAVARLLRPADVELRLPRIGMLNTEPLAPFVFQSVRKHGATTFHTLGVVTGIRETLEFREPGARSLVYEDVFEITGCPGHFSEPGDSGAVVVDALTNRPIGLLVGGRDTRSYLIPIDRILNHFGMRIVRGA
jgi:hypothetical protein